MRLMSVIENFSIGCKDIYQHYANSYKFITNKPFQIKHLNNWKNKRYLVDLYFCCKFIQGFSELNVGKNLPTCDYSIPVSLSTRRIFIGFNESVHLNKNLISGEEKKKFELGVNARKEKRGSLGGEKEEKRRRKEKEKEKRKGRGKRASEQHIGSDKITFESFNKILNEMKERIETKFRNKTNPKQIKQKEALMEKGELEVILEIFPEMLDFDSSDFDKSIVNEFLNCSPSVIYSVNLKVITSSLLSKKLKFKEGFVESLKNGTYFNDSKSVELGTRGKNVDKENQFGNIIGRIKSSMNIDRDFPSLNENLIKTPLKLKETNSSYAEILKKNWSDFTKEKIDELKGNGKKDSGLSIKESIKMKLEGESDIFMNRVERAVSSIEFKFVNKGNFSSPDVYKSTNSVRQVIGGKNSYTPYYHKEIMEARKKKIENIKNKIYKREEDFISKNIYNALENLEEVENELINEVKEVIRKRENMLIELSVDPYKDKNFGLLKAYGSKKRGKNITNKCHFENESKNLKAILEKKSEKIVQGMVKKLINNELKIENRNIPETIFIKSRVDSKILENDLKTIDSIKTNFMFKGLDNKLLVEDKQNRGREILTIVEPKKLNTRKANLLMELRETENELIKYFSENSKIVGGKRDLSCCYDDDMVSISD